MPALLEVARKIDGEALALQMLRRFCLSMGVRVRDIPAGSKLGTRPKERMN
jgi:hypothetical protein